MMSRFTTLVAVLLAVVGIAFPASTASAALIGYWTFDFDVGTMVTDLSGGGHGGTLVGGAFSFDTPAALVGGQSIDLTGADDRYVIIDGGDENDFDTGGALTVSAWVKGWPNGSWEPFVSKRGESGQGWQLRRQGGTNNQTFTLRGTSGADDPQGTIDINNGNWKHVVGTYDGTFRAFYVDGQLDYALYDTGNISDTPARVVFGARDNNDNAANPPNIGNFSQIQLDDIAIYDQGLAPNQVQYLASGGDPMNLPAPGPLPAPDPAPILFDPITGHHLQGGDTGFAVPPTWTDANVEAQTRTFMGVTGHLATPRSELENRSIRRVGTGWIGLTDEAFEGDWRLVPDIEDPTGTLIWQGTAGGAPVDGNYTRWNGGEPNNSGGEDYAEITSGTGWNDLPASYTRFPIYEYDTVSDNTGTFTIRQVRPDTGQVTTLAQAEQLLDGTLPTSVDVTGEAVAVNFSDNGNRGHWNPSNGYVDADYPDGGGDDFVIEATGIVSIPTAGDWTFLVNHDDNAKIEFLGQTVESSGCCGDTLLTANVPAPGDYPIRALFFERGGGDYFELSAAEGAHTGFNASFALVGDTYNGGLQVVSGAGAAVPEPATCLLLALGGLGLLFWRRRTRRT